MLSSCHNPQLNHQKDLLPIVQWVLRPFYLYLWTNDLLLPPTDFERDKGDPESFRIFPTCRARWQSWSADSTVPILTAILVTYVGYKIQLFKSFLGLHKPKADIYCCRRLLQAWSWTRWAPEVPFSQRSTASWKMRGLDSCQTSNVLPEAPRADRLLFLLSDQNQLFSCLVWLSAIAVLKWALPLDTPLIWAAHQKYPKRAQSDPSWLTLPGPQRGETGHTSHSGCVLSAHYNKKDRKRHLNIRYISTRSDLHQQQ